MKIFKWGFGVLALVGAVVLAITFFMQDISPVNQIGLLMQSVGFGWLSGFATGEDL